MNEDYFTRQQEYTVALCPLCSRSHTDRLEVSFLKKRKLVLFGGRRNADSAENLSRTLESSTGAPHLSPSDVYAPRNRERV
jgi:hypothetical protein